MKSKPANQHEQLVHRFMQKSLGGPCLFFADEARKGTATRELGGDLVWATRDVVVLFFLASSDKPNRTTVPPHSREREAIKHNLRQASGVLRAWRQKGQPLTGRNAYQEFSVPFREQRVLVVSVVDTVESYALFHHEEATKLGVDAICTLPHQAIESMSVMNFGICDLLMVIEVVRQHGLALPAHEVERVFDKIAFDPWLDEKLSEVWPNQWKEPALQRLDLMLNSLKHAPALESPFPDTGLPCDIPRSAVAFAELFSDIPHRDILGLFAAIHNAVNGYRKNVMGYGQYSGVHHDIGFAFSPHLFPHPELMKHLGTFVEQQARGAIRPGPLLMFDSHGDRGLFLFGRRDDSRSMAATILSSMISDGARVVGLRA